MEDQAIDFRTLYQQEKRKYREEKLLALMRSQQQTQTQQLRPTKSTTTTTTCHDNNSRSAHTDTIKSNESAVQRIIPESTWDQLYPSTSSIVTIPSSIATLKPNMIHYQQHYITNPDFCHALIQWLDQLPINAVSQEQQESHRNNNHRHENSVEEAHGKWTFLPHAQRRVALFDLKQQQQSIASSSSSSSSCTFPRPLQLLVDSLVQTGVFQDDMDHIPNHILINEYPYPYQGILPHTDGPAYYPKTATLSLGTGSVLLNFTPNVNSKIDTTGTCTGSTTSSEITNESFQVVLHGNGSLIVFENKAYTRYYHSITDLSNSYLDKSNEHIHQELVGPNCCNAVTGTCIDRNPNRISITIRHKY
jgi:hypothetical protein